ncbi:MAG: Uncharacterized protein CEO21_369 [Microgenomates group bacterium Gr01-1014_80]|nr:MAG: Uncharacterized protein CEO21_369 [Microgenomates group bacterium Gr01-1014_80]
MSKRFIFTILTLLVIGVAAAVAIFLAKGYTFNPKEGRVVGTGIITVTSVPDAASVYIDGHLTTATDATISSLVPKEYTVKVIKEGFIPWEKTVKVNEGLVTDLKVTLFPAIPTIYPLTFNSVKNPVLSPDGGKLVFIVPSGKKPGVWVWTFIDNRPIAFARGGQPHQIAANGSINYNEAALRWSPDSKQVLASIGDNNYLLQDEQLNTEPRDITPTLTNTNKTWEDELKQRDWAKLLTIQDVAKRQEASSAAIVRWSPDETKLLFRKDQLSAKEKDPKAILGGFKVFDLETESKYDIPDARTQTWLPDSRHIVLVEDGKISIVEFDGTNQAVIYAGNFEDNFAFAWPDSSRLVVISSFPTPTASEPNLYGINLK